MESREQAGRKTTEVGSELRMQERKFTNFKVLHALTSKICDLHTMSSGRVAWGG